MSPTHSVHSDKGYRLSFGFKNTQCTYRGRDPLKLGCFNCGYYAGTEFKRSSKEQLVSQVKNALSVGWSGHKIFEAIEILSDGSFLSDKQFKDDIKAEIFGYFGQMTYIRRILVESEPEHIWIDDDVPNLLDFLNKNQILEIGVGLETSDDFIRKACINKGFGKYEFEEALAYLSNLPHEYKSRCHIVVYLLVKPAFLTPNEYIDDILNTIRYLSAMEKQYDINIIPKIEPAAISNGTLLSLIK